MNNPEKSSVGGRAARAERNIIAHTFRQEQGGEAVRVPPHSSEAEESLIACCLIDAGDTLARLQARQIRPAAFYQPELRTMFEVLLDLAKCGRMPDEVLLSEELRRRGLLDAVGGLVRLNEITNRVPTTAHREYFLEQVRDCWVLREQVARATERIEACYAWQGGKIRDFLTDEIAKLSRVAEFVQEEVETPQQAAARARERELARIAGTLDRSRQLAFGVRRFDEQCGPLDIRNDDLLVTIAALPGGGKSSTLRQYTDQALDAGKTVLYFNLEGSIARVVTSMASSRARVGLFGLERDFPDRQKRLIAEHEKVEALLERQLFLRDGITRIGEIELCALEMKRKLGTIHLVVVDYLQIVEADMRQKSFTREQEVAQISRRLAKLAKLVDATVLVGAQLSRETEKEGRRPRLSDLRESAAIGQDSRKVIMVHVPKQDCRGVEQGDNQARVMVELLQVKNNNGPKGVVRAWFDRPYMTFSDVAADEAESGGQRTDDGGRTAAGGAAKKPSYAGKKMGG